MTIPPETIIDQKIKIVRSIDRGAQAEIFLVEEIGSPRRRLVAKLILVDFATRDSPQFKRLQDSIDRELDILGELNHRYIGKFLYRAEDILETESGSTMVRGFVMEHSPIGTLARHLGHGSAEISIADRVRICCHVTDAVAEVHSFGITHSDIKAENVLLTSQTRRLVPILIDFGSAFRAHEQWPGLGSEPYLAPELRNKTSVANPRTDVYSLGVLLAEVLSGERLFQPDEGKIDELYLPAALEDLRRRLKRMVAREPEVRPQAAEILTTLEEKQARVASTIILDRGKLPFPYGAFDWRHEIHRRMLKCSRLLILLKGGRPTIESDALERKLAEIGIFGARIRRLIGEFDFMLDVWIRAERAEALREVCTAFNVMTTQSAIKPVYYQVEKAFHTRGAARSELSDMNENVFLKEVFDMISSEPEGALLGKLKERGYGTAFARHDTAIEFIVSFESKGELLPAAREHYQRAVFNYGRRKLQELGEGELLDRFCVLGLKDSSNFLVILSVAKFSNFSHVMLGMMRELREQIAHQDHIFSAKTLVDFDGQPRKEGNDGIIPMLLMEAYL